ncbi:membrane-bound alkaline phosphatase-like [Condylostylus longicornis]|uniref:membrane-bound alkaline phosphatase-like n=1 Tax=Condylostylus longicornis TaxID=2530218 RepID=UPI00244E0B57|nr:membrane-bound alkaline phosphatase-like [Condylostylus longicornis]
MRFYFILIFFTLLQISISGIIPNPEHPAKLTERHSKNNYKINSEEKTKEFWITKGKKFVEDQRKLKENKNIAKNVIFFIGDGLSLSTIAASRVYQYGEENSLSFEHFPYIGLAKTYAIDKIVPDSASTSTSYLCGVKANYGTLGVNGNIKRKDCEATLQEQYYTTSIGKWALDKKKSIGLVTTTRVTHASPGGLYAHIAERNWENNEEIEKNCKNYENYKKIKDIAVQLIHGDVGSEMTVVLGGGRREFRDKKMNDEIGLENARTDGRDLIAEWKSIGDENNENRTFVFDRQGLSNVDVEKTDRLLGLFNSGHMKYKMEAKDYEPSLEEMTETAIKLLQNKNDENGYFLFVEGGLIDVAHHSTYAQIAFNETIEFSNAIDKARTMTSESDTLIVVSSDHSHTMSIAGYPDRYNDIFGTAAESDRDDLPFLTINYANGKGADIYINSENNARHDPTVIIDSKNPKALFPATALRDSETHGGEDVAVFASGPWAHLFTGVYEQNVLPHLMAYASCIGDGLKHCANN